MSVVAKKAFVQKESIRVDTNGNIKVGSRTYTAKVIDSGMQYAERLV
jgi:hypothetical protein